ncbi:MAG: alpha-1,2-fucosyltransferase [Sedimentisphaerales bacterium]
MIIVGLKGGLGNQLFQYAFARNLAHIHNTVFKLDISGFSGQQCSLTPFNIQQNFASAEEVKKLINPNQTAIGKWIYSLFHNHPKRAKSHIKVKSPHFNPRLLKLPDNVYIDGYFQSEKYFINIADIIRDEFRVKNELNGRNKNMAEMAQNTQSVSLHIRRGDYVSNPKANQTHGTCSLAYYYRCIEQVNQEIKQPHFFVFSDDIDWCKSNLRISFPVVFVDHNQPDKDYEDLRLMSFCRHHIIANSSFSWWGAWLALYMDKIVFAPEKWFVRDDIKTDGMIPDNWIKI